MKIIATILLIIGIIIIGLSIIYYLMMKKQINTKEIEKND